MNIKVERIEVDANKNEKLLEEHTFFEWEQVFDYLHFRYERRNFSEATKDKIRSSLLTTTNIHRETVLSKANPYEADVFYLIVVNSGETI